ncbi:MAG: GNAT family protein [Bacillota bacterium]
MIVGERVVLREYRKEDIDDIVKWVNNPRMRKYLGFSVFPQTRQQCEDYVDRQLRPSDDECAMVISLRDDPQLRYIGGVGLHRINYVHRNAELGIAIGREELLGRGLGAEAIVLMCAFGFLRLGLHKINIRHYEYNLRGAACYNKVGFVEVGRLRQNVYFNGRFHDEIYMDMLAEEFFSRYPDKGYLFE